MSVDSRDKRMSMIGLCQPVPSVLPNPDGSVDMADKAMFIWLYFGLTLTGGAIVGRRLKALLIPFRDKRIIV